MKLGIVADIHEEATLLRQCLQKLRDLDVHRIVMLGDVCDAGQRLDETCQLLTDSGVTGVWGNHDLGLCVRPEGEVCQHFAPETLAFMQSLTARMVIDDCYFSHIEPWLNPELLEDLWFFDGFPQTPERREKIFSAQPQRIQFAGHYHRWFLVEPGGTVPWSGSEPVCLKQGSYFVVVNALVNGVFATYDTESGWLSPFRL